MAHVFSFTARVRDRGRGREPAIDEIVLDSRTIHGIRPGGLAGGGRAGYRAGPMEMHATTILSVRRGGHVVVAGDGQVSMGQTIVKASAKKVRRLGDGSVIAGFAGATADAFTLFERFEGKLRDHRANLTRAAVELAKDWRTDRILRRLEALLLVADKNNTYLLGGNGDVVEPDEGVIAIGSGGNYALASARALLRHTDLSAKDIAEKAMKIASEICVYTNGNVVFEELQ